MNATLHEHVDIVNSFMLSSINETRLLSRKRFSRVHNFYIQVYEGSQGRKIYFRGAFTPLQRSSCDNTPRASAGDIKSASTACTLLKIKSVSVTSALWDNAPGPLHAKEILWTPLVMDFDLILFRTRFCSTVYFRVIMKQVVERCKCETSFALKG